MKLKENINNQNGYALLITLLTLMLLTVLGLSLMAMAMNTSKITKSERDSQSSYYIAEAGLVEKRAQINEIARQVYSSLRNEYISMGDPMLKKNFEFEKEFISRVKKSVQNTLVMNENQTYEEQYAESPESEVTVISDATQPLKYLITSVGRVPSNSGSIKEKTVSQAVEIKMPAANPPTIVEIPGTNTVHKLNACYAVQTSEDIILNNGTINGDIYTEGDFTIPTGWVDLNGSIIAKGNVSVSGGDIEGDLISYKDVAVNAWFPIGGNVIAQNNILVTKGPGSLSGKYIYGNTITFSGNFNSGLNKPEKKEKRNDIGVFLTNYLSLKGKECIQNLPKLPEVNKTFPSTPTGITKKGILNINSQVVKGSEYKLVLNEDMYFEEINMANNITLKIDLNNQHRKIYVGNFNNIQGHIELINAGSLEVIVQSSFKSKGEINKAGDTDMMTIRYAGTDGITLGGESTINTSFYIKHAPFLTIENIGNNGKGGIQGDVIIFGNTGVIFGGGASVTENLFLAPLSSITLKSGAAVKGNIISKSFTILDDGTVTPPTHNSGEWEVPGSAPEIIEVPSYNEETNFLITDPLIQK